jgi:phosphoribosylaminoimidazole-succinocarboxamide synthase
MSPDELPAPFQDIDLPLEDRREGKVRVSFRVGAPKQTPGLGGAQETTGLGGAQETTDLGGAQKMRLFVTTDRLSAFDRNIAGIPYKGQVLNQLAAWWFARTTAIIANHVVAVPDPNVLIARETTPLPVEVVVRGAITGVTATSLWHLYAAGARTIYGYHFPDGLRKNTLLPEPIVTPTTKPAGSGVHDEPLTWAEVVERGLVPGSRWEQLTAVAVELFTEGQRLAADSGLILADTKYEFGVTDEDEVLLIDEVHTPDSSRYWVADTYEERLAAGDEPESLDKEVVRRALADSGYRGDGDPPPLGAEVIAATSARYIDAYERITGESFGRGDYPVDERIVARLDDVLAEIGGTA